MSLRIGTLADRKEGRCSGQRINADCVRRTTNPGFGNSGLSRQTWAQNRNTPGRSREGSPEAFAEFGVGFIQKGHRPVMRYRDGQRSPVCLSLIYHQPLGGAEAVLPSHLPHGTGSCMGNPALHCFLEDKCVVIGVASYPWAFWWKRAASNIEPGRAISARVGNFCST